MDQKVITLANGDNVTLKAVCTRKVYREIQKQMLRGMKISPDDPKKFTFDSDSSVDAEDFAVLQMIEKITSSEGVDVVVNMDYIDNISSEDFRLIYKAVKDLTEKKPDLNE